MKMNKVSMGIKDRVDAYNRAMNYALKVDVKNAEEFENAQTATSFAWTRFTSYASCVEDQGYTVTWSKVGPYISEVLIYKSDRDDLHMLTIDTLPNF